MNFNLDVDGELVESRELITAKPVNEATTNEIKDVPRTRKRRRMKKVPDAPKRFKTAYIFFVTANMSEARKEFPVNGDQKINVCFHTNR